MNPSPVRERSALCGRCQKLDFDDFLRGRWEEYEARNPLTSFGDPANIGPDPTCGLCRAFKSIASDDNSGGFGTSKNSYCLYALPSTLAQRPLARPSEGGLAGNVLELTKSQDDSPWFTVRNLWSSMGPFHFIEVPRSAHQYGCLAEQSSKFTTAGLRVRRVDPGKVDFSTIRGWLTSCSTRHGGICSASPVPSLPKGFKVMSCTTRKLQPLPQGSDFAALSYVWGSTNSTRPQSLLATMPLPQTIEDAVQVAEGLNIPFIWVDRYCVPQDDGPEKREQIQNMHEIYRGARVTIIAAAGDSPEYGLPGVSKPRSRPPLSCIEFNDRRLMSTGRSVELAIRDTPWASRAWTFQEGLVSKRKLVFTDEQVYFHCEKREYREAVEEDDDLVAKVDSYQNLIGPVFQCSLLRTGLESRALSNLHNGLHHTMQHFSRRQIGSEDDFLNAATGILNLYQNKYPDKLRHIWGQMLRYTPDHTLGDMMASGLSWQLYANGRRISFPSWSWIGWRGQMVTWPGDGDKWTNGESGITVRLELQDGHVLTVQESLAMIRDLSGVQRSTNTLSRYIHIEVQTTTVRITRREGFAEDAYNKWEPMFTDTSGTVDHGSMTSANGFMVTDTVKRGDQLYQELCAGSLWLGLVFLCANFVLVVKDCGTHFERIGIVPYLNPKKGQQLTDICGGVRTIRLG